jgi:hypothetical protein
MSRLRPLPVLGGVLLAAGGLTLLGALFAPDVHVERPGTDLPTLERRLTRPTTVVRTPAPPPPEPPADSTPFDHPPAEHPFTPAWQAQREEVFTAIFRRVVPPRQNVSREVAGRYRRRLRERRAYLAVLELELVDLIEYETDPYTRWDAEIALAEIYLAQAEVFESTWIPDSFSDQRAARRLEVLDERAAIARDKATLVARLAGAEGERFGSLPPNDPVAARMTALRTRMGDE